LGTYTLTYVAQSEGDFVMVTGNSSTLGDYAGWDNIILTQDTSGMQGFNGIQHTDALAAPLFFHAGLPFDGSYLLAVDGTSAIDHHHQGLPFTAAGRLAVALDGTVDRIGGGAAPFDVAGRLVVGVSAAIDHTVYGVPYDAQSRVVVVPKVP
jgi:hypothetical protein